MNDYEKEEVTFLIPIVETLQYITSAPYFWISMGSTAALAIFVGAILYDGVLSVAAKGTIATGVYAFFIIETHIFRVNTSTAPFYMAYANVVSIAVISIFWLVGIIMGVTASYLVKTYKRTHGHAIDKQ